MAELRFIWIFYIIFNIFTCWYIIQSVSDIVQTQFNLNIWSPVALTSRGNVKMVNRRVRKEIETKHYYNPKSSNVRFCKLQMCWNFLYVATLSFLQVQFSCLCFVSALLVVWFRSGTDRAWLNWKLSKLLITNTIFICLQIVPNQLYFPTNAA